MKKIIFTFVILLSTFAHSKEPLSEALLKEPLPSNLWIEMSRLTQPGVVGVYLDIDIRKTRMRRDPMFDLLEEFFGGGGTYRYEDPRQESQEASPIGTGFVIDKQGHIVTNYHVIEPVDNPRFKTKLQVSVNDGGKLLNVKVIGRDKRGDLALLKIIEPPNDLQPLQFGDSDNLSVGEYVAAFGNPYGHSNSMTVGIVSAKGRAIKEINRFPFIQTDASINPGNSGGPLLNTKGYVIGVNTAIDARAQGIGFAIPSNYAKKIIATLKAGKKVKRGFLGISPRPINPRAARAYGIPAGGVMVSRVEPGFPADKAGIKENDIIVKMNGKPVKGINTFLDTIQDTPPGEKIKVGVMRPTDTEFVKKSFTVALANYPDQGKVTRYAPPKKNPPKYPKKEVDLRGKEAPYGLGFAIVTSSSGNRRELDVPIRFPFGPIVSGVVAGSPAARGGFKKGMIVLRVNGSGVNSVADVMKELRPGVNRFWVHTQTGEKKISLKSE